LDWFSIVEATVINGQSSCRPLTLPVDLDETMAELNIAPAVILLRLHFRRDDGIDPDDRDKEKRALGFE